MWHRATEIAVPADAAANPRSHQFGIACAAAGVCVAGGGYTQRFRAVEPMAVSAAGGRWARAVRLRLPGGVARPAANPYAEVSALACPAAGRCVAVGEYDYGRGVANQSFIASQASGRWGRAVTITLPANAAAPRQDALYAVACTRPGQCVAGGYYVLRGGSDALLVVTQSGGRWGPARQVRAPADAAAVDLPAFLDGLSCPRPGYCTAVGGYQDRYAHQQALAVTQSGGRWGRATQIRLPRGASSSPDASLTGVACRAPGACVAVGDYLNGRQLSRALAMTQSGGQWGRAALIGLPPGTGTQPGDGAELFGVACPVPGRCVAVGDHTTRAGHMVAMAVTQSGGPGGQYGAGGQWGRPYNVRLPRNAGRRGRARSFLFAVSCVPGSGPGGGCAAAGIYADRAGHDQPMVAVRP